MKNKKLSELATIVISGVDKKTFLNEKKVKLCNYTDVYNNWSLGKENISSFMDASANEREIEKFLLKKGFVALTKDSETREDIGISCLIRDNLENTILGYHSALIKPNEKKIDGSFLNSYFKTKTARKYFSNQASGSGQRYTLTVSSIGAIKIPIISLKEQKKIANLFNTIDKKININKTINDNL